MFAAAVSDESMVHDVQDFATSHLIISTKKIKREVINCRQRNW